MTGDYARPAVRIVRALTRFHYAGVQRRTFKRDAGRDRRKSQSWGWHENVVGIGVSQKRVQGEWVHSEYCVTFFVLRKEPMRKLLHAERIPPRLELESTECSVVTDVVEVPGRCVAHASTRVRPLQPGAEVGHARGGRGTLGLIVRKTGASTPLALSCSHVIARSGSIAGFGRSVEQPVGNLAEAVGTLTDDFSTLRSGTLVTGDVALARLSVDAEPALLGSAVVPLAFSEKSAKEFRPGMRTRLFGMATQAVGEVDSFESTWDIAEMPFVEGHVEFTGLVAYKTRSAKGDSGGLVMSGEQGEESLVLGLHTAGREDGLLGLFQPIGPIMKRFKLELV